MAKLPRMSSKCLFHFAKLFLCLEAFSRFTTSCDRIFFISVATACYTQFYCAFVLCHSFEYFIFTRGVTVCRYRNDVEMRWCVFIDSKQQCRSVMTTTTSIFIRLSITNCMFRWAKQFLLFRFVENKERHFRFSLSISFILSLNRMGLKWRRTLMYKCLLRFSEYSMVVRANDIELNAMAGDIAEANEWWQTICRQSDALSKLQNTSGSFSLSRTRFARSLGILIFALCIFVLSFAFCARDFIFVTALKAPWERESCQREIADKHVRLRLSIRAVAAIAAVLLIFASISCDICFSEKLRCHFYWHLCAFCTPKIEQKRNQMKIEGIFLNDCTKSKFVHVFLHANRMTLPTIEHLASFIMKRLFRFSLFFFFLFLSRSLVICFRNISTRPTVRYFTAVFRMGTFTNSNRLLFFFFCVSVSSWNHFHCSAQLSFHRYVLSWMWQRFLWYFRFETERKRRKKWESFSFERHTVANMSKQLTNFVPFCTWGQSKYFKAKRKTFSKRCEIATTHWYQRTFRTQRTREKKKKKVLTLKNHRLNFMLFCTFDRRIYCSRWNEMKCDSAVSIFCLLYRRHSFIFCVVYMCSLLSCHRSIRPMKACRRFRLSPLTLETWNVCVCVCFTSRATVKAKRNENWQNWKWKKCVASDETKEHEFNSHFGALSHRRTTQFHPHNKIYFMFSLTAINKHSWVMTLLQLRKCHSFSESVGRIVSETKKWEASERNIPLHVKGKKYNWNGKIYRLRHGLTLRKMPTDRMVLSVRSFRSFCLCLSLYRSFRRRFFGW